MRGNRENGLELVMRSEAPLAVRLLVALAVDQVQSLGWLRSRGCWRRSPAEIGDWLRGQFEDRVEGRKRDGFLMETAMEEWRLWGAATDVLLARLEGTAGISLDRDRMVALAREVAEGTWDCPRRTARGV